MICFLTLKLLITTLRWIDKKWGEKIKNNNKMLRFNFFLHVTPSIVLFFYIYMKKHSQYKHTVQGRIAECCFLPGMRCMKTVGTLWRNSMTGWSAMASSRKKTMVEVHAIRRAIRAPKMSPNLEKKKPTPNRSYWWAVASAIRRKKQYQQKKPMSLPSKHGATQQLDQTHRGL